MNDTSVIGAFLGVFGSYIDSGFGLLGGEVGFLSSTLIVDVTIAGLFWAWGADEDVLQRLVKDAISASSPSSSATSRRWPPSSSKARRPGPQGQRRRPHRPS
jgi:hypothetical protein